MTGSGAMVGAMAFVAAMAAGLEARGLSPAAQDTRMAATAPVNLNVATTADLERLPVIGPAMATRILEYRQKNGGFKKIEELMNVKGIGEKNFLKLKTLVTVAPAKTADR